MLQSVSGSRPVFAPATVEAADPRVLVLFCHPAPHRSRVNRALAAAIRGLPGVSFHDLYEACPDFHIDVAAEQARLAACPVIVLQHPFYWYSTPALVKEWQDHVLAFGWAYGPGGNALAGKMLLSAVTTGGQAQAYRAGGMHGMTVRTLLAPIAQTARLCGMSYVPPFVVYGTHQLDDAGIARAAARYRRVIEALRDGTLDVTAATADGSLDDEAAVRHGDAA